MSNAKSKLSIGRRIVCTKMPYLSTAVYAMAPVETPGLRESAGGGTAVTETGVLLYDPEAILEWGNEDVATAIYHEVGHILRDHIGRAKRYGITAGGEDAWLWNLAGDRLINDDAQDAGFKLLPSDTTSDSLGFNKTEFRTTEETFEELKKRKTSRHKQCACCGSGSGNKWKGEQQALPQSHPAHRPEADLDRTRRVVAEEVKKHAAEHGRGSVPGGLLSWADLQTKPAKVPWTQKLARIGRRALAVKMGDVDYTFSGISHLQGGLGFGPGVPILPVLRAPEADVFIAIDTSGSMGKTEIETSVSEAEAIMKHCGARVRFLACDCAVHAVSEVRTAAELVKLLKGGGGTSFKPVFQKIAEIRKKPDVLIFITDGCGDAPLEKPSYHTIWVLVGRHKQMPTFGDCGSKTGSQWGEIIEVNDD